MVVTMLDIGHVSTVATATVHKPFPLNKRNESWNPVQCWVQVAANCHWTHVLPFE